MVAPPLAFRLVPTQPSELYDVLADFLIRLHCAGESDGLDALAQSDLSFSQARALFVLTRTADPMPIHSIAEALGLSVAAAGRNVDQLLRLDLVERRESATDRRVKLVSLRPAGAELVAQHLAAKRDALRAFTDALPPEHSAQLLRALTDILAGDVLRPLPDQENHL
jgi:DNA-binding MarR family transcriptional regulator